MWSLVLHTISPSSSAGWRTGTFDRAVMAVENTLSGSILPNFRLLAERDISIIGEVRMPVAEPGRPARRPS